MKAYLLLAEDGGAITITTYRLIDLLRSKNPRFSSDRINLSPLNKSKTSKEYMTTDPVTLKQTDNKEYFA